MNNKKGHYYSIFISLLLSLNGLLQARSIHRPQDPLLPMISVNWANDSKKYTLRNFHLEEYPLFTLFDKNYFYDNLLPKNDITLRQAKDKAISGAQLSTLVENLLQEIQDKKKKYTDFVVLQHKGFNRRKACGLLIAKFKDHPFVVKLFIETPKSFVNPWAKGFEPIFFFYMGGGVNRHLSGFTRLKNLTYVKNKIAADPYWATRVDTPRKWFWISEKSPWLEIRGTNIGGKTEQFTQIPGVYAIIADAIEPERNFSSMDKSDMNTALQLATLLESNLDLHITNFMVEKHTGKIVIIDTEHFPTMIGLKKPMIFDNYVSWYAQLIGKCSKDMFFNTKKERRLAQNTSGQALAPYALIDL